MIPARAKVNLTLEVLGRRPDGYHEISTVFQSLSLQDKIWLRLLPEREIRLQCDHPALPTDGRNLAYRAAELMMAEGYVGDRGVEVVIEKRIPVAAGLAGGSSDAAAVLVGLNALLGLGLPAARLRELGALLGSDVPFCITGGTALGTGRGERLRFLPDLSAETFDVVLATPPFEVSTRDVYSRWRPRCSAGACGMMVSAIERRRWAALPSLLHNDLQEIVRERHPVIGHLIEAALEGGAQGALMSGSGPTVFALVPAGDRRRTKEVTRQMGRYADLLWVCRPEGFVDPGTFMQGRD